MERDNGNSRQNPSNSRRQNSNRPNLQREVLPENKDISNRRRCPDCDGRIPKESSKSKSRVWKKVMWFTRRSKNTKNDICQCRTDEVLNSSLEERHSNSWSFTRSASRKFRISSRKRQCKSDSFKKSCIVPSVKQIEVCTADENLFPSTRTGSVCSSGTSSPTATGSFCDFGATTSHAGWRGSRRHKNAFVLTEIAREINPPVKNDDILLNNMHPPLKKLSKSSSTVSHISRRFTSPVLGNVRRSKSFPGSQSCSSPSKRRFINTTNKTIASFSPPLKQKCYGLRRTVTFSGRLNTEFPKTYMKKSKSINNADMMKLDRTSSLGEIRDQSGSIVGIVHFYKSPNTIAPRRVSCNKDTTFVEEELESKTVDPSSNSISTRVALNQTLSGSQKDASLETNCTTFDEISKRDCEKRCKVEVTKCSCSSSSLEQIVKPMGSFKTLLNLSQIREEISESSLCDNLSNISVAINANKLVKEFGVDSTDDPNVENISENNYVDTNDFETQVSSVVNSRDCVEETKTVTGNSDISTTDASNETELSSSVKKEKVIAENAGDFKITIACEPGLLKDEILNGTSTTEAANISNLKTFSGTSDDHMSDGSCNSSDLSKEQPSTVINFQHSSEDACHSHNCMSDNCCGCGDYHDNQHLTEPQSKLASVKSSGDVKLPCVEVLGNCDDNHLLKSYQDTKVLDEFMFEKEGEKISNEQCSTASNSCSMDINKMCVSDTKFHDKSEDNACRYGVCQSHSCLIFEIPVDGTEFPEINSTLHNSASLSSQSTNEEQSCGFVASQDHDVRSNTNKVKLSCDNASTSVASMREALCVKYVDDEKEANVNQNDSCLVLDSQFSSVLSTAEKSDEKSSDSIALGGFNDGTSSIEPASEEELCRENATDDMKLPSGTKLGQNSTDMIAKPSGDVALGVFNSETSCVKQTSEKINLYKENLIDSMEFSNETKMSSNSTETSAMSDNDDAFVVFDSERRCLKAISEKAELFGKSQNDKKLSNEEKSSQNFYTANEITMPDINDTLDVFNGPTSSSLKPSRLREDNETLNGLRFCPQKSVDVRNTGTPVSLSHEKCSLRRKSSSITSPGSLEHSKTSDYASMFDESFSNYPEDVPIHTWKTSESDLKSEELGPPVPGETFKMRTEIFTRMKCQTLMLSWFQEFNDEQKNIILKKVLDRCELPQMHLLSVAMENNLHKTCPPNCQDMLVWLPYTVTLKILMYLDPVSLCRCNQVNRAWNELADSPLLWQQLTRNPDYQLCEASSKGQLARFTHANGEIHWKKVFAERFLLQRNWLNGKYDLRTYEGHNQGIACVQFDDTRIVSGSYDKTIKLWDISNMPSELMLTLEGHSGTVRCLDLNGNRLVSGSTDRTIKVWDLSFASYWAGASCKVTMVGHLHTVRCLQADEKKLVSGSYDKTVKVWDLKTGECQLTLRGHTAAVLCVQFDDQKIVSGSYDKKIKVWDLTEGTCLMTLDGHQDAVTCLNLTHDGMKIITGSLDYSLKFWDLSTGKCYGTLDWITSEGHTAVVRCLQVDSWRIVSGGDDKTLKVWELATGQRLLTLRYHSDGVTCMQFNDFAIVSGSYDRTVKLWDFTPKHPYLEAIT